MFCGAVSGSASPLVLSRLALALPWELETSRERLSSRSACGSGRHNGPAQDELLPPQSAGLCGSDRVPDICHGHAPWRRAGPPDVLRVIMFVMNFAETWLHGLLLLSTARAPLAVSNHALAGEGAPAGADLLCGGRLHGAAGDSRHHVRAADGRRALDHLAQHLRVLHRDQHARDLLRLNPPSPAAEGGRACRPAAQCAVLRKLFAISGSRF